MSSMVMTLAVVVLTAYIAVGIAICYSASWVRKREQASFGTAMLFRASSESMKGIRMFLFRASLVLGLVFLWPVFLLDERRVNRARDRRMMEYERTHPFLGFTYHRIGGDRVFLCRNCDRTFEVGTGSHGVSGLSRGYQCQACGKCDTRYYEEPFAELGYALPKELTSDELARVRRSRNEAHAAYQASLVCECGGPLDRDKLLFCPGCRSTRLEILARMQNTIYQLDPVLGLVPVIEGNRLHHNGARYRLRVALLEKYLQQYQPELRFCWNDESSASGYVGTWEIKDGRLYLTHLAEFSGRTGQHHPTIGPDVLRDRFPTAGESGLFADRFGGMLRCPYGEPLQFLEPGFASTYPHELLLGIENGVLVSEEVKDAVIPPAGYPRRAAA